MWDELWCWDAGKLNEAIRTRAVSCKEVVTSCLTRVEAVKTPSLKSASMKQLQPPRTQTASLHAASQ
jgi:Asp-tRNA(Asn)/Glu-tRNA(Gln) amidotransferase A subunit family amidase